MSVNLKSLVAKLNDTTRAALEAAAGLCLSRTNYDVEIEHFLMKLLDSTNGDLGPIMKRFEVDRSRFAAELTRSLDKLKSGNARTPALSPYLLKMFTEAWTLGSINFGAAEIRSGFAILALAATEDLARLMRDVSREFQKIDAEALRKEIATRIQSETGLVVTRVVLVPVGSLLRTTSGKLQRRKMKQLYERGELPRMESSANGLKVED